MGKYIQYYVEGQNEKTLVDVLKTELQLILPGKAEVLNHLTETIRDTRLRTLHSDTTVVLIFDTDVENMTLDVYHANLAALAAARNVDHVLAITQVKNIEDELIYSTDIKTIRELLPTKTDAAFKHQFNEMANETIARKLTQHKLSIKQLWSRQPDGKYRGIVNSSNFLKKRE